MPMVVRIVGHERRGGGGRHPRGEAAVGDMPHEPRSRSPRRGGAAKARRAVRAARRRGAGDEHPHRAATRGSLVQGITGREGEFHARAMLEYGTPIVAGVTPGKGGQRALDGAVPVFDTVADAVRETGANTTCIFVPAGGAPDAVIEAVDAGIATIFCITEGIPALDMIPAVAVVQAAGARLIGPNCPGATSPGECQGRDHPGLDPPRGPRRRRLALGHAHVRGGPGDERRGPRPVDVRRHRRRPGHRDDVPRRRPAVRRRPRHRRDRPHRRDRRRGRGGGSGLGRRAPPRRARRRRSSPAARRPRASAWAMPGRSSRAARARPRRRSRRSRRPGFRVAGSPTELPQLLRDAGYRG